MDATTRKKLMVVWSKPAPWSNHRVTHNGSWMVNAWACYLGVSTSRTTGAECAPSLHGLDLLDCFLNNLSKSCSSTSSASAHGRMLFVTAFYKGLP